MQIGDLEYPSLKGVVSDAEWQARVDLAAIYRLIPMMGWWDLSQAPASATRCSTLAWRASIAG